jgi:N6-L-threonylcarbamoyladenine synthase
MRLLGIETSCDETAASVVEWNGHRFDVMSSVVASQIARHAEHGGVVPELATREHVRAVEPVTQAALHEAKVSLADCDAIVATRGPGLAIALSVGHTFGRALALASGKPFLGVNHMEGHLVSPLLDAGVHEELGEDERWVSLIVSGGHTLLMEAGVKGDYRRIGGTRDDAAGEAFDKGARLLGLPYPGGPHLERCAKAGNPHAYAFPRGMEHSGTWDFSFSGLKTALRVELQRRWNGGSVPNEAMPDLAASYQAAIVDVLVNKTVNAALSLGHSRVMVAGGVACNRALVEQLDAACRANSLMFAAASPCYCTDNAAMIAAAGALRLARGERSAWSEDIDPNLRLA